MPARSLKHCAAAGCHVLVRGVRHCQKHQHLSTAWSSSKRSSNSITGRPWRRLRQQVLERDNYLCQCSDCKTLGKVAAADEVDHIVPVSQGGKNDMENLQAINKNCHKKKTNTESLNKKA